MGMPMGDCLDCFWCRRVQPTGVAPFPSSGSWTRSVQRVCWVKRQCIFIVFLLLTGCDSSSMLMFNSPNNNVIWNSKWKSPFSLNAALSRCCYPSNRKETRRPYNTKGNNVHNKTKPKSKALQISPEGRPTTDLHEVYHRFGGRLILSKHMGKWSAEEEARPGP